MYSYYLDRGVDLEKLINLDFLNNQFYIASMIHQERKKRDLIREAISSIFGGA